MQHSARLVIGMDIWSKKGLDSSYLAISACMYRQDRGEACHVLLDVHLVPHPHSGAAIAEKVKESLARWEIPISKVLLCITDNGTNMVKAVKILNAVAVAAATANGMEGSSANANDNDGDSDSEAESDDDGNNNEDDETETVDDGHEVDIFDAVYPFRRLACMPHSMQLVVKTMYKIKEINAVIAKARAIVRKVKISSVAVASLLNKTGKVLIMDMIVRWNSTYLMLRRLIELKQSVIEVLNEIDADGLQPSDWAKLEALCHLLKLFSEHTKLLEGDDIAMSAILPSLMDLEIHLEDNLQQQFVKSAARAMLDSLRKRFNYLRDSHDAQFEVIPAAATLLDPTVARIVISGDKEVFDAAKKFILRAMNEQTVTNANATVSSLPTSSSTSSANGASATQAHPLEPPLKRFKCLSRRLEATSNAIAREAGDGEPNNAILIGQLELEQYISNIRSIEHSFTSDSDQSVLHWWKRNQTQYINLSKVACDLLSYPASQAYVERVFSFCGIMTSGRRNRMSKSLAKRIFLKINKGI